MPRVRISPGPPHQNFPFRNRSAINPHGALLGKQRYSYVGHRTAEGILLAMLVIGTIVAVNSQEEACQAQDQLLDLSSLGSVSINPDSSVASDLLQLSFWGEVYSSARTTYAEMLPQTILGFINSSQQWRDWLVSTEPATSSWLNGRIQTSLDSRLLGLISQVVGSNNSARAVNTLQGYAQSASGYTLAAIDYLTLGGLSSIRNFVATDSLQQALCVSFPGQIAQLFEDSVNPNIPENLRAQYLGSALAVTSLTVVLSGSDALSDEFGDALSKVELADAWPTIKSYLFDIGSTVSETASYLAFTVAEELVQRFPQNPVWVADLTLDRIDSMTDGLASVGDSAGTIEQKISGLAEAAPQAGAPDDIAIDADVVRYQAGAGLSVEVGSQNRLFVYTESQTMEYIQARFLQQVIPGFAPGKAILLSVDYLEKGALVYHQYTGGDTWIPTAPESIAQPGDLFTIKIQVLNVAEFVSDLPSVTLGNYVQADWVTDLATLSSYSLDGSNLGIRIIQSPSVEDVSAYTLGGTTSPSLGFNNGRVLLDVQFQDIFGNQRAIRISYNGYSTAPTFGLEVGQNRFPQIVFMSNDGVRLKIVYSISAGENRIATLYLQDPSSLYTLGTVETNVPVYVKGQVNAFEVESVDPNRQLEKAMMVSASTYDLGRLGSEIAYTVGKQNLGLGDLVIAEPSRGGPDLYTADGNVVIQARMLTVTEHDKSPQQIQAAIGSQMADMNRELKTSFRITPSAKVGYLILSYLDPQDNIKTIVLQVSR